MQDTVKHSTEQSAVHQQDSDCAGHIDAVTGLCVVCGVLHGDACPVCKGKGFHAVGCTAPLLVNKLPMRPAPRLILGLDDCFSAIEDRGGKVDAFAVDGEAHFQVTVNGHGYGAMVETELFWFVKGLVER